MRFIRDNRCASLPSSKRAKLLTRLTEAELEVERKISWKVALNTVTKEICMYVSITSALTVSSEFHGIKSYPSLSLSVSFDKDNNVSENADFIRYPEILILASN